MNRDEFIALTWMVQDYPIHDLLNVLEKVISNRIDELSDNGLNDDAKELTRVLWHLQILSNK
jgi:hypothetical protein